MGKKRKPTNKQALYSSLSCYADDVISRLIKLTKSKNENVALGACKVLLNKTLPDIKSIEISNVLFLDYLMNNKQQSSIIEQPQNYGNLTDSQQRERSLALIRLSQAELGIGRYKKREIVNDSI